MCRIHVMPFRWRRPRPSHNFPPRNNRHHEHCVRVHIIEPSHELAVERSTSPLPSQLTLSWGDRLARRLLLQKLQELNGGTIQLTDSSGSTTLGQGGDLQSKMHVHNPAFFRHAVLGGSLSVAESYLRGDWDCDDLTAFFRIFVRNIEATDQLDRGLSRIAKWVNRLYHRWHANSKSGSRRNIHAHYDLGNDFFRLMLDDTLAYSSGIFLTPTSTLREASMEKMDRICRKLDLRPSDHLLEIGTGWGGLAIHAATQFGCRVTTTTISQQQFDVARAAHRRGRVCRIA